MKSRDDIDDDYLDDPIKLNFDESAPRLDNVEFLDPGIIDVDCDSEDFQFTDEDTTDNYLSGSATSLESVTTTIPNRVILKPMSIKLVDCYKFPWYFDQFTEEIIKNNLINSNSKNISINEEIMDISSIDLNYELPDDNVFNEGISITETSGDTIDVNFNELSNDNDNWEKEIDMNQIRKSFGIKLRVIDHKKRLANTERKNELELLKAMSQRNKTGVDIKKNIGLVGMKVKRMTTERQSSGIKYKTNKNQTDSNMKRSQETKDVFLHAVDKDLIDMGTTIETVSKEVERSTRESELNKLTVSQDIRVDLCDSFNVCKDSKKLKSAKNGADLKNISARRDKVEEDMQKKINKTTKIAEEIVRIITSESGGICQINEGHKNSEEKKKFSKPMPYSKKIEIEQKSQLDKIKNTLKQQRDIKECKTTKMITPIPLSTKARNREKQQNSIKKYEVHDTKSPIQSSSGSPKSNTTNITSTCTNSHDMKKPETQTKVITFQPASPNQRSDTYMPSKSFPTLNKFTERILSKIHATKKSQINKTYKLDETHTKNKNLVVQPKSTNECKSLSSVFPTIESNVTNKQSQVGKISKMASPYTHPSDETAKDVSAESKSGFTMSPKKTLTQPQYSYKRIPEKSPKRKLKHIVQNTLPLNTIVMNTAKTDCAKIDTSSHIVKNTLDNATNSNNAGNISKTIEEHFATNITGEIGSQKQSIKVLTLENVENFEENLKTKENLKQPFVSQESSSNTAAFKDKFNIQTIITTRNELDAGELRHESSFLTYQTHAPKTQDSAIIRPTQTHNRLAEANKPLTVHNSMQSHILYRPQAESRSPSKMFHNNIEALWYHNPMPQMNQPVYHPSVNPMCYPSWCPERNAPLTTIGRLPNGFNGGIPAQVTSNTRKTTTGNDEIITPDIEIKLKSLGFHDETPPQSVNDARQMPLGLTGQISPQIEMQVRNHGGILPLAAINNSPMPARVNGTVSQELKTRPGVNRRIPTHMAFNNRPMPPGLCNVQPNTVFWSSAFPPPKLPPPPPDFPPSSQETKTFPSSLQTTSSSIIGRNNEGIIKKINISAQVFDHSTETDSEKGIIKSDLTLPYDDVLPVAPENSRLATTKSEMLRVLDTSMHRMQSPVNHSNDTVSIPSKPFPLASPNDMKSSLHLPSSERLDLLKVSKNEKSHQNVQSVSFESNRDTNIKQEVLSHNTTNVVASLNKITMPVEPKIHREIQSKPQVKSNRLSDTYSARPFKDNSKPIDKLKETLTDTSLVGKVMHSKAKPIKSEEVYKRNNKRESWQIENNVKPDISARRADVVSPINLKRALPMDQTKNTSSTTKCKPGPLSKKKFDDSKGTHSKTKTEQKTLPNKGYSAPILPIPTYEKILSEVPAACTKLFDRPVVEPSKIRMSSNKADAETKPVSNNNSTKPTKKRKHVELNTHKVDKAKKISLEEYKKRSAIERKGDRDPNIKDMQNDLFKNNTVYMPRRTSYVDSDLGYDSDSTVKL